MLAAIVDFFFDTENLLPRELSESGSGSPPPPPDDSDEENARRLMLYLFFFVVGGTIVVLRCLHCCFIGPSAQIAPKAVPKEYIVADAVFNAIDTDRSGTIEPAELLTYLIARGEKPSDIHKLLMRLDENQDGKIDREEWRKGWVAGFIDNQAVNAAPSVDAAPSWDTEGPAAEAVAGAVAGAAPAADEEAAAAPAADEEVAAPAPAAE